MVKPNKAYSPLEFVSHEFTDSVCKIDAPALSSDVGAFRVDNSEVYYIAINSWLLMISDIADKRAAYEVYDHIAGKGLIQTIDLAAECAASFVDSYYGTTIDTSKYYPFRYLLSDVGDDALVLQCLRYLKRFSPKGADKIISAGMEKFWAINRRCRDFSEKNECWVEHLVRDELARIFDGFRDFVDEDDEFFSSGVCYKAKTLSQKLKQYSKFYPALCYSQLYPIGDPADFKPIPHYGKCEQFTYNAIKPLAVPKNYKAPRIIAPEQSWFAAKLQGLRLAVENTFKANGTSRYFDVTNQDRNREIAKRSSISGKYCTVDLSSASDTEARGLCFRLLPREYTQAFEPYMVSHLKDGKQERRCNMLFTSGNPLCFITEGAIFLAVYRAATKYAQTFFQERLLPPYIFGDDGLVDARAFTVAEYFLEKLGFIVNIDKTFGHGTNYRESCGVEYISGYPLMTSYWPRKTLEYGTVECITSLCALQHKLYDFWSASRFIEQCVLQLVPDMTHSPAGEECCDLWGVGYSNPKRSAPLDKRDSEYVAFLREEHPDWLLREVHYVVETEWEDGHDSNVDMYYYMRFLKRGPYYASPLDRILGVSSRDERHGGPSEPILVKRVQ